MKRAAALGAGVIALTLAGIAPGAAAIGPAFDSQRVVERYTRALAAVGMPHAVIVDYEISQEGPASIEERHVLYRSGIDVRDETVAVDGLPLTSKRIVVTRRVDRYAITRVAPTTDAYGFVFVRTVREGTTVGYRFETVPLAPREAGFVVTAVTIDARRFLPLEIDFRSVGERAHGHGVLRYAPAGRWWMPLSAYAVAVIGGATARERIVWSAYRFPPALPAATFATPRPLPSPTLPTL